MIGEVIQQIIGSNQLAFHILVIAASLFLMAKASDLAVLGVSKYAQKLGLSDYIIGMLIVAAASSMPEFVSSITGAGIGESGIVIGSMMGASMAGLALVLGIGVIINKRFETKSKILEKTNFLVWLLIMLPFLLMLDGNLSRLDGIILVAAFIIYTVILWKKEGTFGKIKKDVKLKNIWKDGLIFSGSLVVILLSARYLVFSCIIISRMLSIPPYLIALTVIAVGATMPDIMVSLKSIKQKHAGIGYGNVIGSMVMHLLFLGVIVILVPLTFNINSFWILMITFAIMSSMVLFWARKGFLTRAQGISLFLIYLIFIISQIVLR